jgi:hypothetical protein
LPTATITPTMTPTPSPTPVGNWLRLSTSSVDLTCRGKTTVTLKNAGPATLSWHATSDAPFYSGVSVSPSDGSLRKGKSVSITIQSSSFAFSDASGTIDFVPENGDAGDSAALQYTVRGC